MTGEQERDWQQLLAQYELLQAASTVALKALLEAYRYSPDGNMTVDEVALTRYKEASALRMTAEAALLQSLQSRSDGTVA